MVLIEKLRGPRIKNIEGEEIWGFVGAKRKMADVKKGKIA